MAFFGKVYSVQLDKDENFDGFLKALGLPEDKVKASVSQKSSTKIDQNGDSYILTQSSATGNKETVFKSGEEFDDTIGEENTPIKSTITVSGNTMTHVIKGPLGSITFKREYNGADLNVTITADKFDGVCKRFYRA